MKKNCLIGLDFDNTIACYDQAINTLANKTLDLPIEIPRSKLGIRNYLRSVGREEEWTCFQGRLYGPGMKYAHPFDGAIETMHNLLEDGYKLVIVSHRSRQPYAGPKHDLHRAARQWISEHLQTSGLFTNSGHYSSINFLETKREKLEKIRDLKCNVFVDDLPEVIEDSNFPLNTQGVLFAPERMKPPHLNTIQIITTWKELPQLIPQLA